MTNANTNQPTTEQIKALATYQAQNGRNWKFKLCVEWMNGTTTGILQEIRNQLGPNWLANYRPTPKQVFVDLSLGGWR